MFTCWNLPASMAGGGWGAGSTGQREGEEGGRAVQGEGQAEGGDPLGVVAFLYPRATQSPPVVWISSTKFALLCSSHPTAMSLFTLGKRTPAAITGVFSSSLGCLGAQ